MRAQAEGLLGGRGYDGFFGYVSTIAAALSAGGIDPQAIRFLRYKELTPDLYGSVVMASRKMIRDEAAAVGGVVRALNRGLVAMLADQRAAIEAVRRKAPTINPEVEALRLLTTLQVEMSHAEGRTRGIGAIDPDRFTRSIALISETNGLKRTPAADEVFTDSFLPPMGARITTLAL